VNQREPRYISASLRRLVVARASNRCEYCRLPQSARLITFPIDHIIAVKHGGKTEEDNLALSCLSCNLAKGSDIASLDPITDRLTPFFSPRSQTWIEHFESDASGQIRGKTSVGRTTVRLLQFNEIERLEERRQLFLSGEIL